MENFKWFEKWYSTHVINNHKNKLKCKIENLQDFRWKISIDFDDSVYPSSEYFSESKKKSNYNHYKIEASKGKFRAEGDFAKLDFLIGKFRTYIGQPLSRFSEQDYFMKPDIQDFIFRNSESDNIFLHYTPEKEIAEKIIKEGFIFCNFDKTTAKIQNDEVALSYNHIIRKPFGTYVVVIVISKKIYDKYLNIINQSKNKYLKVEEVLTVKNDTVNENGEKMLRLHPKYIKGYFDYRKNEIFKNPNFNSGFDSDMFLKNIP